MLASLAKQALSLSDLRGKEGPKRWTNIAYCIVYRRYDDTYLPYLGTHQPRAGSLPIDDVLYINNT